MLSVEDWAEIRRLHRSEQMPIKAIARVMGCSKNTVKRALAADGPPRYQRVGPGSVVDEVEPRIRELLRAWPSMPATVIAERIDWEHRPTVLEDRVRALRPYHLPPDPASRTECDLGHLGAVRPGVSTGAGLAGREPGRVAPVLVMTSCCSRMRWATMIPSRTAPDLIAGHLP